MNRCLLFGLLFAASSIGLSLLFSDVSKAQSDFDNTYITTDMLYLLKNGRSDGSFDFDTDITHHYDEIINGTIDADFPIYYQEFYNRSSGSPINITSNQQQLDFFRDIYNNERTNTVVNQRTNYNSIQDTYNATVEICATTERDSTKRLRAVFEDTPGYGKSVVARNLDIQTGKITGSTSTLRVTFEIYKPSFPPLQPVGILVTFQNNKTSSDCIISTEKRNQFQENTASNFYSDVEEIVYPENYEGQPIRDVKPDLEKRTFMPEWSWSITQDGKLSLTSQNNDNANLDAEAVLDLWKDSKDWQFPSTEVVDAERQRPYYSAKFEHELVKEEQWITVTLQHDWKFCLMEGTCKDNRPDGITHIETVIFQIYWDGKSFIAGNNANGQEDCELQEDGGIFRRICNSEEQEPAIMRTLRSLNSNMHGLTQIITAPLSFIASLITYNNNCTNLNLPLPSTMNRDLSLPCMTPYYQQYLGFLFNLYQTILTALVCYYCFVNTLAYVKRGQNPKNDRIEVAHL